MTKYTTTVRGIALAVALCVDGSLQSQSEPDRLPIGRFTIPRLGQAPVVDGRLAEGEWDDAVFASGIMSAFTDQLMTSDTGFGIGWHGDRLYFLARCRRGPSEWKLRKQMRFNDDYNWGDPSIEIWISPPARISETYQSVINTYPAVLDNHQIPSRGYHAAGWKGNWTIGVGEDPDQYWIEASIPIADFGFETIRDGDVWRLLMARTCHGAKPHPQGSWSITQAFGEIAQHPPVVFREDPPVVRVENVHTVLSGRYRIPMTLKAPGSRAAVLTAEIRWHGTRDIGGEQDIVERRTVRLSAGERQTLQWEGDVPDRFKKTVTERIQKEGKTESIPVERKAGYFTITVAAKDEEEPVFRQSYGYEVTGWEWTRPQRPTPAQEDKPLAARVQYGPENHTLLVLVDVLELSGREKVSAGQIRIRDPRAEGRVLKTAPLSPFRESYSQNLVPLEGIETPVWDHRQEDDIAAKRKAILNANQLAKEEHQRAQERYVQDRKRWESLRTQKPDAAPPEPQPPPDPVLQEVPELPKGPEPRLVSVEVEVLDAEGGILASDRQEVKLLRHRFAWQGTDAGVSDKVIPPWTPVQVEGTRIRVWNREYELDGLGIAQGIRNGGISQIQSMRLIATVNGNDRIVGGSRPEVTRQTEAWVDLVGNREVEGIRFQSHTRVEFDGCLIQDLTYGPADPARPIRLEGLRWEVELPAEEATHFCASAGGWTAVHDVLQARWTSQQTGSGMLMGDFVPYIWINNGDRAFLWFADNDKGWVTEQDRAIPTQEIVRKGDRVVLTVRLVEIPVELNESRTLRQGWMVFPSRPLPPGFRSIFCATSRDDYPGARATHFWFEGDWAVLWPYYCSPFPWNMEKSKSLFEEVMRRTGPTHHPCVGSIAHSIGRYQDYEGRPFPEFSVDWGEQPGVIGNSDVTQSRGPIDFRVYHYRRWVREAGFRGLYVDENYIGLDRNPLTGGAYVRPDGVLQHGYTYLGLREYYKRMMTMFHQEGVPRPNIWLHTTGGAAFHAWLGDIFMEGENVEPSDQEWDYLEVLPAGRMIAIGSPTCNGALTIMMCQAQRHSTPLAAKHIHQFMGWVLAHDIMPEQVRWFGPLAQAGRFHAEDVRFHGYWKKDTPVQSRTEEGLVSVHRTDRRAVCWVVNTSRQDRTVAVAVDWKRLGLSRPETRAFDVETGREVALNEDGFEVQVPARDFAGILLVQPRILEPRETFRATFDGGIEAEEAIGCELLPWARDRVSDDRGGQALAVGEREVQLWGHLNLQEREGRIRFRGLVEERRYGTIFRTVIPSVRGIPPRGAPILFERRKGGGNTPDQLVLRVDQKPAEDGTPPPSETVALPLTAGWHEFELRWKEGTLDADVDGQNVLSIAGIRLNLHPASGPEIVTMARFVFGGPRSCLSALDDLKAWR